MNSDDIELLLKDKRVKEYLDHNYEKKNPNIPSASTGTSTGSTGTSTGTSTGSTGTSTGSSGSTKVNKSSIYAEEASLSKSEYIPTSTLWNEIKSLFGFSSKEESHLKSTEEESHLKSSKEENKNHVSSSTKMDEKSKIQVRNYYEEEEEKRMIYNENCEKPKLSDQMGMYAGDHLYSVAQF